MTCIYYGYKTIKKNHYYHAVPVPESMKVVVSTLGKKTTTIRVGQTVKVLDDATENSPDVVSVQFGVGTYGTLYAFQLEKETNINLFRRRTDQRTYHHRNQYGIR